MLYDVLWAIYPYIPKSHQKAVESRAPIACEAIAWDEQLRWNRFALVHPSGCSFYLEDHPT